MRNGIIKAEGKLYRLSLLKDKPKEKTLHMLWLLLGFKPLYMKKL